MLITSVTNPKVKFAASLDQRKTRRESGQFIAEGLHFMTMAQAAGWIPDMVFFERPSDLAREAKRAGAECYEVTTEILSKLSTKENPQKIVGVFKQRWGTPADVQSGLWAALEDVRDPGNLGTIIRTADAAGAQGIILVGNCCDPYARESVRASMGSVFSGVKLVHMEHEAFRQFAAEWKEGEGKAVVGTHLLGRSDYRTSYPESVLLVMGNEGAGMSEAMLDVCTHVVKIPMRGVAESLNVATATALMMYEIRRPAL